MTFGKGSMNFIVDKPAAVAQAVLTRLLLWQGEFWLNLSAGTPWLQQILGKPRGPGIPDQAIRSVIAGTPYVTGISDFAAYHDTSARTFTVSCKLDTAFGTTQFRTDLSPPVPVLPAPSVPGAF